MKKLLCILFLSFILNACQQSASSSNEPSPAYIVSDFSIIIPEAALGKEMTPQQKTEYKIKELERVLARGANINSKDDVLDTALIQASMIGDTEIVKFLLEHGAKPNIRGQFGATALMYASNGGYSEIVKMLLDAGADINIRSNSGDTALMAARAKGYRTVIEILEQAETKDYSGKDIQQSPQKVSEDPADILVNYLEKHNELYALLMQKNPSFKTEMKQVVKEISPNSPLLRKWNETHSLDVVDLEAIPSVMGLLEKEFSKYMRFASDQDIYDMYQTEYNHMVKNNCQVFPIPEEDRQETIRVKSKLVNNSVNNPYKGEVMSEEEAAKAFKQIGAYYGKKGYGIGDLMIILDGGKNLSRKEQCRAVKQFYEAILSLPKATSGKLVRTISQ